MRFLLDASTFLWWVGDSSKLSTRAIDQIKHLDNEIYISLVCIREIQIKYQIGRVDLPAPLMDIIHVQHTQNGIAVLPMTLSHMQAMTRIPNHHADPFDRMLVAQAMTEDMAIITPNKTIAKYPVKVLW